MLVWNMNDIKKETRLLIEGCKNCSSHCEVCEVVDNCLYFLGDNLKVNQLKEEEIIKEIKSKVIY